MAAPEGTAVSAPAGGAALSPRKITAARDRWLGERVTVKPNLHRANGPGSDTILRGGESLFRHDPGAETRQAQYTSPFEVDYRSHTRIVEEEKSRTSPEDLPLPQAHPDDPRPMLPSSSRAYKSAPPPPEHHIGRGVALVHGAGQAAPGQSTSVARGIVAAGAQTFSRDLQRKTPEAQATKDNVIAGRRASGIQFNAYSGLENLKALDSVGRTPLGASRGGAPLFHETKRARSLFGGAEQIPADLTLSQPERDRFEGRAAGEQLHVAKRRVLMDKNARPPPPPSPSGDLEADALAHTAELTAWVREVGAGDKEPDRIDPYGVGRTYMVPGEVPATVPLAEGVVTKWDKGTFLAKSMDAQVTHLLALDADGRAACLGVLNKKELAPIYGKFSTREDKAAYKARKQEMVGHVLAGLAQT